MLKCKYQHCSWKPRVENSTNTHQQQYRNVHISGKSTKKSNAWMSIKVKWVVIACAKEGFCDDARHGEYFHCQQCSISWTVFLLHNCSLNAHIFYSLSIYTNQTKQLLCPLAKDLSTQECCYRRILTSLQQCLLTTKAKGRR